MSSPAIVAPETMVLPVARPLLEQRRIRRRASDRARAHRRGEH
jgi:hypothetical protein